MNNQPIGIHHSLEGFYKVAIVDPKTTEVVWESDWNKNLILNNGMDSIWSRAIVDQMLYGISGAGTRPNSKSGTTSTITQSGAGVFLYNTSGDIYDFTSSFNVYPATVEVGDVLKYANNSESKVVSVNDGFNLTVDTSYTIAAGAAQTFTVWKTSQTGLQTEISRSGTYLGGTGNCGTTTTDNTVVHRRSYDFPTETSATSYNEMGVAWASSGANTTFSRILLGAPITIMTGYKLRLIYDLYCTWYTGSVAKSLSVGGWPVSPATNTNGTESIQTFLVSTVNATDGTSIKTTGILDPYFTNESSVYLSLWASPNSASLSSFNNATSRTTSGYGYTTATMTKASQTIGTYQIDKTGILLTSDANVGIRSIGLGRYQSSVYGPAYDPAVSTNQVQCFVLEQSQSKVASQTLSMTYRWTWTRTLV